ncbi:MAG: hypothetical protein M3Z66_08615 [Chloroflexota bacterium]|nr:hypothetical protein [Chloroflexota bacterium]
MIRRLMVFAAMLLASVATTSAAANPVHKTVISTVSHGVKLTLRVPRRVYPQNALVRVVVTMRNLSQQDVQILGQGRYCCFPYTLGAVVRDRSDQIVYPGDRSEPTAGPPLFPVTVAPRHSMSQRVFLVLRAGRVQGVVQVQEGSDSFTVQTPMVAVRLVTERAPRVILHAPVADQLTATIRPPTHMKGYLYYLGSYLCGKAYLPAGLPYSEPFDLSLHSKLTADCSYSAMPVTSWYVLAGWLNHPVVAIDYTRPSSYH